MSSLTIACLILKRNTESDRSQKAGGGRIVNGRRTCAKLVFGHPELFANVGIFSSGECFPTVTEDMDFSKLFSDAAQFNESMDVVYITCGEADPRYDRTTADLRPLQDQGFKIEFPGLSGAA